MKVTEIHIRDFHQFKDLKIDLTYPMGHEKAGEPLEKVCVIGQSGTGKTKLLEILSGLTYNKKALVDKYNFAYKHGKISLKYFDISYTQFFSSDSTHRYGRNNYQKDGVSIGYESFVHELVGFQKQKPSLIYYPAELKYGTVENEKTDFNFAEKEIVDFSLQDASAIWTIILKDIQKYQEEELNYRQEISRVAQDSKTDIIAITEAVRQLEEWQNKNFNPVLDVADKCLDPLLSKFHLRVKTKLDIQKKDDIGFIKIEDFNGNEIPYGLWSTGTKQIVLSALPLYLLKPQHALILFDEPERSLYPDLQKLIIDYYLELTTDCQFFFSTHSPIIASSFEPWEIVELKFNKEGYVYQELYYDGERHIDNYTITPSYLTYDLMLSKVFDLKETYPPIRDEKITEVLMLRNQLERLKQENKLETEPAKKIYDRYIKLAKKLSWEFELPQHEEA